MGELINAIQMFYMLSKNKLILFFTSPPEDYPFAHRITEWEAKVKSRFKQTSTIYIFTHRDIRQADKLKQCFNPLSYMQGKIPYTDEYFMSLATDTVRQLKCITSAPKKIIAVDCDNTLWKGVVGEDGVDGIQIPNAHLQLQQKLLSLKKKGFMISLCSKNNVIDVKTVFDHRADMILRWNDLSTTQVNWNNKVDNLRSIARELNIGTDSIIFIDDSPIECMQVTESLPEVEVINFPAETDDIASFLDNIWSFDVPKATREDAFRTQFYQNNHERKKIENAEDSLEAFIERLELKVDINLMQDEDIERVAQLSMRTNQFNTAVLRYDESKIYDFLSEHPSDIYTVSVTDKFGDYGLVGVMMLKYSKDQVVIENMFLSCRALGRGVENTMHKKIVEIAKKSKLSTIVYRFCKTERNIPAEKFLHSISHTTSNNHFIVRLEKE